ncbi:MAG: RusA family crossover junction endodeoxyribonuclease [Gammaproteobacteria bacterium]|nr:RusA family crossover junction endodeoxyribonuclease [Gammaproteobacteria bacterium]MBU0771778.1 RusA family crossover junction endodeoxyribonuclease [Gammaproteobacteria bacterium]MBU0855534.1 RusA family crossover junction endodeoxyribonuclease [Gammaproteobacteria bacterium]MBU1846096.1 RusA family crossover junction endodeoxyribonuclease [Gammaproteobacteria bacterium]
MDFGTAAACEGRAGGHDVAGGVGEDQGGGGRAVAGAEEAGRVIRIIARGTPAPQGSKSFKGMSNAGRAILAESSKKVRPWRQDVKAAAEHLRACTGAPPIDGPVVCRMTFTLPKPTSAPKRRRTYPMRTPDLSKLVRSTEDALTDAGIWTDDARVIGYTKLRKTYPMEDVDALDTPGVVIEIMEVV